MSSSIDLQKFVARHLNKAKVTNDRHITYTVDELKELVKMAIEMFQKEPKVPCLKPSVVIVGDIHGQYFDLLRMFSYFASPKENGALCQKYMFLGDYVDRGRRSLEVVCLCVSLKLAFPTKFVLLRGNHETKTINRMYGFYDELLDRFPGGDGDTLWNGFNEMFSYMPLAGLIGSKILCMHGGISKHLTSIEDIENIPRPLEHLNQNNLAMDLLWADPMVALEGYEPNTIRGVSTFFGEDAVHDVCAKLKLDLVVRAHQMMMSGYGFFANKKMVTVFTAPCYQADAPNNGAVIEITREGRLGFKILKPKGNRRKGELPEAERSTSCVQSFGPGVTRETVAEDAKHVKKPPVE